MFFCDEVGAAEGCEDSDARAERGALVTRLTVAGKTRDHEAAFAVAVDAFLLGRVTTLEEAAAIGACEAHHAQSEDDCDCQC